jgi:hypothetical protein
MAPQQDTTKTVNILAINDITNNNFSTLTVTFVNSVHNTFMPPPGLLIVPNPDETYLKLLPEGAILEQLVVVKEFSAPHTIFPLIDTYRI